MIVNVRVVGSLKRYVHEEEFQIELKDGISVKELKSIIGIPLSYPVGYVVNDSAVDQNYKVNHNDAVIFVMLVGGG